MKQKNVFYIIIALVLFSYALGIIFYAEMPKIMVSHWNSSGDANGYMPRFWAVFLMPIIITFLNALFLIIPHIDPMKDNFKFFRKYYDNFIILITLFMIILQMHIILWNLGYYINFNVTMPILLAIIFYYSGILIENTKRNWFVGIRTPWTLSSDKVWEKTHKLGGNLFKIASLIALCSIFFQKYALWIAIIPVIIFAFAAFIYSYFIHHGEKKTKNKQQNLKKHN